MNNVWSISHRPKTVKDCILPKGLEDIFSGIVDSKMIPNMIFHGDSGVGKTTVARAICNELDADYMFVNASKDGDIDTIRTKIQKFASTVSMSDSECAKVVILDECDGLTRASQPALRAFIEEFAKNCRFIMTCNFINKIIDPLQSRCHVINFKTPAAERPKLAEKFMNSVISILDEEGVTYDKKVVANIITKHYPDFRRVLNDLQAYSIRHKKIDTGILTKVVGSADVKTLVKHLKEKEFTKMRKWIALHVVDTDPQSLIRDIYDGLYDTMQKKSIPKAVMILAECQYRLSFVADPEIQLVSAFTELITECEWA